MLLATMDELPMVNREAVVAYLDGARSALQSAQSTSTEASTVLQSTERTMPFSALRQLYS